MEPAVSRKYCKDQHHHLLNHLQDEEKLKGAHEEGCSSADTWNWKCGVQVCEIIHFIAVISVREQQTSEKVVCDKAFKSLPTPNQNKIA